jgi:hypothetical protein
MLLSGDQSFLPVVQLCVSAQLWQALSAAPSFKPRENSASRCRQKGSIADEVIELHVAVLHRTQVSPPMEELGHSRCTSSIGALKHVRRCAKADLNEGNRHRTRSAISGTCVACWHPLRGRGLTSSIPPDCDPAGRSRGPSWSENRLRVGSSLGLNSNCASSLDSVYY